MAGVHEHLEHAEHAQHHAHSSFDRRVAMSMAIVAAILAGVSMYGHRKHNEVLVLKTESAQYEVKSSNGYAWYQSTKSRQQEYILNSALLISTIKEAPKENAALLADLQKALAELPPESEAKARETKLKELTKTFEKILKEQQAKLEPWQQVQLTIWAAKIKEYQNDSEERLNLAKAEGKNAEKKKQEAEHAHHQADRLDFAHLAVELGLVLCSIAVKS